MRPLYRSIMADAHAIAGATGNIGRHMTELVPAAGQQCQGIWVHAPKLLEAADLTASPTSVI